MSRLSLAPTLDQAGAWSLTALSRGGLGERVGLEGLQSDLRRRGGRVRVRLPAGTRGMGWDRRDARTHEWWPQGVTTSADNGSPLLAGESRTLLASWYRKDGATPDTAVRVSVVDLGPGGGVADRPAYEHVLLVEADRDPVSRSVRHRQVRLHAGGLVWWGELLLVADTRAGLRIFDLRDVVRVAPGTPDTHGCRYVLPQCGRWTAGSGDGLRPLRWSFCSIDRSDADSPALLAGEYSRSGTGARLARFPLPDGDPTTLEATEIVTTDIPSMQGVCRVRGSYIVSASHGARRRGHLWVGGPGGFHRYAGALPVGPEDLSLDPRTGRLWTMTEYPGRRAVVSLPVPHDRPR